MKLWEVRATYGLWVVQAHTAQEAIEASRARSGPGADLGWSDYGAHPDEVSAETIEQPPEPAVLAHHFG